MSEMQRIRKAVLPVAGLGTRFLPATKAVPKEMLNIVDRPMIQYIVDEAVEAGIEHIVFVTGRNKHVIEDYFDYNYELNDTLLRRGKNTSIEILVASQPRAGAMSFTRQQEPLGLGHAVWCARDIIGNEPFALLLPDMIMLGEHSCTKSMIELYEKVGGNIIALQSCDPQDVSKYGIVAVGKERFGGFEITDMVEKPKAAEAPSNLYINGRYILAPDIFGLLETQTPGAGGEIQLTDAMRKLAMTQTFHGFEYTGRTFDCGSREGFLEANVAVALSRDDTRDSAFAMLQDQVAYHQANAPVRLVGVSGHGEFKH